MNSINKVLAGLAVFLFTIQSHSSLAKVTIYGQDAAKKFHSTQEADFYIQFGTFSKETNAVRVKQAIKKQADHPVLIKNTPQYNVVLIGPIDSAENVRAEAQAIDIKYQLYDNNKIPAKGAVSKNNINPMMPNKPQESSSVNKFGKPITKQPSRLIISADVSTFFGNAPNNLTVDNGAPYPTPYNLDFYTFKKKTHPALSISAGYQNQRHSKWIPSYTTELRYQHIFSKSYSGTITQYSLPEFTNYNYSLDISSNVLLLYSKIDLHHYGRVTPFIDIGVGAAVNNTRKFKETALPNVTPRISPDFGNHLEANFAGLVGLGLDLRLKRNLSVTLGYNYEYLGTVRSELGLTTWMREALGFRNFKGSLATLGLIYYFDEMQNTK